MGEHKFDPENITKSDMQKIAGAIEEYVDELKSVMVIPDELLEQYGDQLKEGLRRTEKLIKKLKKGDKSIFKDEEDWNFIV